MKSTIAIGDIHGSTYWEEIVSENPDCRYVFLGDYLDPYEFIESEQLIDNLEKIIQLKKDFPEQVILLFGNHDLHYFLDEIGISTRFDTRIAEKVSTIFIKNFKSFQYAYQEEKTIFTHAGISQKWFTEDFKGEINRNIAEQLNTPLFEQYAALFRCGEYRGGNRGDMGGIFWADIMELSEPLSGFTQVVGHNRVKDITEHENNGGRIIFCDCLFNKRYLKL